MGGEDPALPKFMSGMELEDQLFLERLAPGAWGLAWCLGSPHFSPGGTTVRKAELLSVSNPLLPLPQISLCTEADYSTP